MRSFYFNFSLFSMGFRAFFTLRLTFLLNHFYSSWNNCPNSNQMEHISLTATYTQVTHQKDVYIKTYTGFRASRFE